MFYAVIATDRPDALDVRMANREAHLAYIEETGVVAQAGPFLDSSGEMCGSLLILDVETLDAAQDWAARDPYALAALFESVSIQAWKRVISK